MADRMAGLNDYIDVAQRIADFRQQYPEGSLQPVNLDEPFTIERITGVSRDGKEFTTTMIVYTAAAYRSPTDVRPGIGMAWEVFPGRTPYTLGSELMNAETSAWGRAIIAALASDSRKGVASREEVRNRVAERDTPSVPSIPRNRDGSVSRSRTSDEQKQAAGVMTTAQQTAHTALQRGATGKLPAIEAARVQHGPPADDPWKNEPE
jgi:hypothetical protein